jgi:hypothetical protein
MGSAQHLLFNLDDRSYRDIRLMTPTGSDDTGPRADNPGRTMLGSAQLAWIKQGLLDAQAQNITWKFVAVSSPIDQILSESGKHWPGGYRAERQDLLKFIADNHIDHVVFLTTDDHQVRINELDYLTDPNDPTSMARVPGCFSLLVGPLGAGGPDAITDHSFDNIKSLADARAQSEIAHGLDPIGLDPAFPGLSNVFREGDPDADALRQPVDFYSPDTFNYAALDVSADGGSLTVSIFGIDSFSANTFLEPDQVGQERLIMRFQINSTGGGPETPHRADPGLASVGLWSASNLSAPLWAGASAPANPTPFMLDAAQVERLFTVLDQKQDGSEALPAADGRLGEANRDGSPLFDEEAWLLPFGHKGDWPEAWV